MYFTIDHLTRYQYSVPIRLGEHRLRFLPWTDHRQRPGYCYVATTPAPRYSSETIDEWGNRMLVLQFDSECTQFEIRAHIEAETVDLTPLDVGSSLLFPVHYGVDGFALNPYLQSLENPAELRPFIEPILAAACGNVLMFLLMLNSAIHQFYHSGVRIDGPPRSPAQTLGLREGVCRDLAVLFMAACRQVGLASRFVSGYQQGDGTRTVRYLHAWAQVYLPGLGWHGFDPTQNVVVGADHLAIAAAPTPPAVTPVEGGYTFQGTLLNSTLDTDIQINTR